MAKDAKDDAWRRLREREDERAEEQQKDQDPVPGARGKPGSLSSEKFDEMMGRAEPMIEQVNSLYNMYFSGAEKRPPVDRRQQLDQLMQTMIMMGKPPIPALQFRFGNLQQKYASYKDRWERALKEFESGGRKRLGGR